MKISEYIEQFPKLERRKVCKDIALRLNVSESSVAHWRNGTRKMSPLLVLQLEKYTNELVTRYDMRPDIYPPPEDTIPNQH